MKADQAVKVDAETAAAIERGIKAAEEGRVVPAEEVRKLIPQWIAKFAVGQVSRPAADFSPPKS